YRVLKVGGQARVLEFSEVTADWFKPIYDFHSFKILPKLGKLFDNDSEIYEYLAEIIRKHPPQDRPWPHYPAPRNACRAG
ncbi:class I SAM-dependent methyltransferase, partial [Enterobacter hormaechei]|uniref:class I SAM-dependent methyltransferase n=1 Tax=Enterobacter hormaechei TaxID=158836 RepID=UPI002041AD53